MKKNSRVEAEASCFTRNGARRKAARMNAEKRRGRSSGWNRFDFTFVKRSGIRPWKVVSR